MPAAPITLKKVELLNFLSHKHTVVNFDRGVTVIVGENGAGKTSILEAIFFALTGTGWRGRRGERAYLINAMATEATVRVWLNVAGEELFVERVISRRGRSSATLRFGKERVFGDQNVTARVREIMGLSPEALGSVAIVGQGSITNLFGNLRGAQRKELIDKLLELDAYRTAWEELGEYAVVAGGRALAQVDVMPKDTSIRRAKEKMGRELARLKEAEEELRKVKEELKVIEEAVKELRAKLSEAVSRKEEVEKRIKELEAGEQEYLRVESVAERLEVELRTARERVKALEDEVRELEALLTHVERESRKGEYLETARRLREVLKESSNVEENLATLKEELRRVKDALAELNSIKSKYPEGIEETLARLTEVRSELDEMRRKLRERSEEVGRIRGTLESISDQALKLEGEVRRTLISIANTVGIRPGPDLSLELVENAVRDLENRLESDRAELRAKLDELRRKEGELEALATSAREKLELMRSGEAGKAGKCPLCGSPLDEGRVQELMEKLALEIRAALSERSEVTRRIKEVENSLNRVEARLEVLKEVKAGLGEVSKKVEKLSKLRANEERLKNMLDELEDEIKELERHIKDLEAEEKRLAPAEKDAGRFEKLESIIASSSPEALEARVAELEDRLRALHTERRELKEVLSKVFDLSKGVDEVIREAEEAARMAEKAVVLRARFEERVRELKTATNDVKRLEDELAKVRERMKELKPVIEELSKLRELADNIRERVEKLREALAGREAELRALRKRVEELEEWVSLAKEDAREYREALFKAAVLLWLRNNVLSPDGAPKLLRQAALRSIEALMRKYLELFNTSYSDVRIDDDLNVNLSSPTLPGTWVEFNRLSGGEKVVVSLSALLALHQVVSKGRLGFLILDEPTEYLDDERRKQLIEVLKNFREGRIISQLIIVTHDEDVKEAADAIFRVSKDVYSQVEEVEVTP